MEYAGKPVDAHLLEAVKRQIIIGFLFLTITTSTDEKKQKALDRLVEIGHEANDLLNIVINWKVDL